MCRGVSFGQRNGAPVTCKCFCACLSAFLCLLFVHCFAAVQAIYRVLSSSGDVRPAAAAAMRRRRLVENWVGSRGVEMGRVAVDASSSLNVSLSDS